ncbi:hypothetical protein QYM13_23830 [Bacillus pacificus]|uniref:hypothetical protein n=1 Tax=Bacillus pacificus TaxID=2026187 RepID=UPI0027FE4D98|nr:hypothetical protein [Bacillus pacificus]MDQ7236782.1 hypothetical protein [Bacillus pacificus]MDQ7237763.1 hypothetical protein [Bacillus pacificus]
MDDIKTFTLIVTTGGVMITAILTHFFTLKREKYSKTFEHKLQILKEVYTPIYRVLMREVEPGEGYQGLGAKPFLDIMEILEDNIELVDPNLESILWNLKEEYYYWGESRVRLLDEDRNLLDFVLYQYNVLRKDMGLPYDASSIGLKTRVGFYLSNIKRNRKSRLAREVIKRAKKNSKTS